MGKKLKHGGNEALGGQTTYRVVQSQEFILHPEQRKHGIYKCHPVQAHLILTAEKTEI